MSIIYDALQKTQRNREYIRIHRQPPPTKKPQTARLSWMIVGSFCLVLSAGLGGFISFYTQTPQVLHAVPPLAKRIQQPVAVPPVARVAPVLASIPVAAPVAVPQTSVLVAGHLVLNGVLISSEDKLALINNQPFHLGDRVEGMTIVGIEPNAVQLQKGAQFLELRVSV